MLFRSLVDNGAATTQSPSNPYVSNNTVDKVYLLSYQEAASAAYGLSTDASATAIVSDYARVIGAYIDIVTSRYGNTYWWLRSPKYFDAAVASIVYNDGYLINYYGGDVNNARYGVRPAIRIN